MRRDSERPDTELTGPHKELIGIIQEMGLQVTPEYPVGPYTLDCYLPEAHIGIEVDGPYHFRGRDERRTEAVWQKYMIPVLRVPAMLVAEMPEYIRKSIEMMVRDFEGDAGERKRIAKKYEREHDA